MGGRGLLKSHCVPGRGLARCFLGMLLWEEYH